ncbi:MAG: hypothetical protein F4X97_17355 [Boseongicola sp. SB0662_bin_57]|nr:hypothetical protein [Boseongicola sp. SB0662_bin_57]
MKHASAGPRHAAVAFARLAVSADRVAEQDAGRLIPTRRFAQAVGNDTLTKEEPVTESTFGADHERILKVRAFCRRG